MNPEHEFRFRAWIAFVAVGVIVVGLVAYQLWPGANPEKEFARARQALVELRSWRYHETALGSRIGRRDTFEVVCPSRMRLTITQSVGESPFEYVHVDGKSYYRTPGSRNWSDYHGQVATLEPAVICGRLGGRGANPFPPYEVLLMRGFPKPGKVTQIDGVECREWTVKVPQMGIQDDSESFCLATKTFLPVYRMTARTRYAFYDFNAPITIEAPPVAPPPF